MSEPVLIRTAKAIYRSDTAPKKGDYGSLTKAQQRRYEAMAAGALSVALRLDLDEESEYALSIPE